MRILHCCLSCFYIDNYNYQENILPIINKLDGNEVKIIASTETFLNNSTLGYIKPEKYFTEEGVEINRIPYKKYLPHFVMKKIRDYKNLYNLLDEFFPDVILFHGAAAYALVTVAKYKKNNPHIKFYIDSHEDKNNSGTNWLSRNLLHKIFYKSILKKVYNLIDKVFYVTYETKEFLQEVYAVKKEKLEYFPLGGNVFNDKERTNNRKKIREQLNLKEDDILVIHSGKMDKFKRTEEILAAFTRVKSSKLRLILIGSINDQIMEKVQAIISIDTRVSFLGWKSGTELMQYLCACDLYIQPGGQSVTMQSALCCGSAAALYPHESHKYLLNDSVFYIKTIEDMIKVFEIIAENRQILEDKRERTSKIAREKLDYKVLASRLYN